MTKIEKASLAGMVLSSMGHGIYQDALGRDRYAAIVVETWIDSRITLPIEIVVAIACAFWLAWLGRDA